eukprot:TRINITY_DN17009_c0_g1_i1.p1 TRINITY_DN17009_c0_g1~~TRINITY_DN17009_c0_g1_i1.p1  ORF type:complete len:235 (-),score=49.02 TRINITY_DN17009_c0_g1_i1:24-728(-)
MCIRDRWNLFPYRTMRIMSRDLHELLIRWPKERAKGVLAVVTIAKTKFPLVVRIHYSANKTSIEVAKTSPIYSFREVLGKCYRHCQLIAYTLLEYTEYEILEMIAEFSINDTDIHLSNAWQIIYRSYKEAKQREEQAEILQSSQINSALKKGLMIRLKSEHKKKPQYAKELSEIIGSTVEEFKQPEKEDPDTDFLIAQSKKAFATLRPRNKLGIKKTILAETLASSRFAKGCFI